MDAADRCGARCVSQRIIFRTRHDAMRLQPIRKRRLDSGGFHVVVCRLFWGLFCSCSLFLSTFVFVPVYEGTNTLSLSTRAGLVRFSGSSEIY